MICDSLDISLAGARDAEASPSLAHRKVAREGLGMICNDLFAGTRYEDASPVPPQPSITYLASATPQGGADCGGGGPTEGPGKSPAQPSWQRLPPRPPVRTVGARNHAIGHGRAADDAAGGPSPRS